jgi:hypothetical protein
MFFFPNRDRATDEEAFLRLGSVSKRLLSETDYFMWIGDLGTGEVKVPS